MKTLMQLVAGSFAFALAASFGSAQPTTFSDGFEYQSLDPFWFGFANQGSITFPSTAQAHSGSQSVQFNSPASLFNAVGMYHVLPTPVYGQVSVWVYDTGADLPQSHTLDLQIGSTTAGWALIAFPALETYQFRVGTAGGFHDTGIDRTLGWHQFAIRSVPDSVTLAVDGITVYSSTDADPFTSLQFGMQGGPLASGWVSYWDDFASSVTPVPEPSTVVLFVAGAVGILCSRALRWPHKKI